MNQAESVQYLSRLDEPQRRAVLAQKSCVVTAGAGAGKTTVLAARFVHLVVDRKIPLRSILALTFTRKAAGQMYERIYLALADQNSRWAREQLEDFQNAQITTIDSFCTTILRDTARDFGYSPEFTVDAETCADLALSIAQRYIRRNRHKEGLRELLAAFSPDDAAASLFADLGLSFISPLALSRPLFEPMKEALATFLADKLFESQTFLENSSKAIAALADFIREPKKDCAAAIEAATGYLAIRGALGRPMNGSVPPELGARIKKFSELGLRSYSKDEYETAVKISAKTAREEADRLTALSDYEAFFPSHRALLSRLDEYASELAEAKRLANIMDFKDLGLCAVEALRRRKDMRNYWKQRIASIMIDEFQDNNQIQKDLLYLLAERRDRTVEGIPSPADLEEGKLFFVGDEKQSIYRFRGADVSVFKSLSKELRPTSQASIPEAGNGPSLSLPNNYRSSSGLIRFFNRFFADVLDAGRGETPRNGSEVGRAGDLDYSSFEADYAAMEEGLSSSPGEFPCLIRYYLMESRDEQDEEEPDTYQGIEDDDDRLAFEVADFIRTNRGALKVRRTSSGTGEGRPSEFEDFAILLRSRNHQHRLEKYLRTMRIPYEAETPRGLYSESPANDIYHILRYAVDPADRVSYAAVLRSPLVRVSEEAFLELLSAEDDAAGRQRLSVRDRSLLKRMDLFFDELRTYLENLSTAELVERIWHKAGLRLDILARPGSHSFLEHFDYIFHLAARADREGKPLSAFLETLGAAIGGRKEAPELDNVPRKLKGGVRILTIHKAKGLEFPIVIIPWIESTGKSGRSQKLWQMLPEGLAVDVKPFDAPGASARNILFDLGKEREEAMEKAEIKRLLYVACTRAEDHLVFFAKNRKTTDQKGRSFKYYLDAFCRSPAAAEGSFLDLRELSSRPVEKALREGVSQPAPDLGAFGQAYKNREILKQAYPRSRLSVTALNAMAKSAAGLGDSPQSLWERGITETARTDPDRGIPPPTVFGSLCHDMTDFAIRNATVEGYSPGEKLVRDLGSELLPAALDQARHLVEAFLASEFWRSVSSSATRIRTEAPFLQALGGFYIEGRMDLLVESREECIVVDFKTDEELDPREYRLQLELYRRAAEALGGGRKARACLYWLKTGQLFWQEESIADAIILELARRAAASEPKPMDNAGIVLE